MFPTFLRSAFMVGFSGSRVACPVLRAAFASVLPAVGCPPSVVVGCARGVDELARAAFPGASVFSVASGAWGSGRSAFARRSVGFVSALSSSDGVLVSLPSLGSRPAVGLVPSSSSSRCFSGGGSGSWASLAFAVGSGVPCVVFLGSFPAPAGWDLAPVSGCPGWFVSRPAGVQLSLF
jgi:hypothetical protein